MRTCATNAYIKKKSKLLRKNPKKWIHVELFESLWALFEPEVTLSSVSLAHIYPHVLFLLLFLVLKSEITKIHSILLSLSKL